MKNTDIVISSFKNDGSKFRPSDWVERMRSSLSSFTDKKSSINARACIIDGEKCFIINSMLAEQNPKAYKFVMQFAESNNLSIKQSSSHIGRNSVWSDFEDYSLLDDSGIPELNEIVLNSIEIN